MPCRWCTSSRPTRPPPTPQHHHHGDAPPPRYTHGQHWVVVQPGQASRPAERGHSEHGCQCICVQAEGQWEVGRATAKRSPPTTPHHPHRRAHVGYTVAPPTQRSAAQPRCGASTCLTLTVVPLCVFSLRPKLKPLCEVMTCRGGAVQCGAMEEASAPAGMGGGGGERGRGVAWENRLSGGGVSHGKMG